MKTKTIIITAFATVALFTSCRKEFGKGPVISEVRSVASFTKIKVDNSATVQILKGDFQKVEVSDYENLLDYLSVETINNELVIRTRPYVTLKNSVAKVTITTPDVVTDIKVNGSSNVFVSDTMSAVQYVRISGIGSFLVYYNAFTSSVDGEISGSGDIEMKGMNTNASAKISGSGSINFWGLYSQHAVCNISGSGNITIKAHKRSQ